MTSYYEGLFRDVETVIEKLPPSEERDRAQAALQDLAWWVGAAVCLAAVPAGDE